MDNQQPSLMSEPILKYCKFCDSEKDIELFTKDGKGGRTNRCKQCASKYVVERFNIRVAKDPTVMDRHLAYMKERHAKQRKIVFDHYGRICVCCGETNEGFFTIDHIEEIGSKAKRQELGQNAIYNWLIQNNFPPGFRVMCYNCNCGRAHNDGICPHHQEGSQTMAQASSSKRSEVPEAQVGCDIVEPVKKFTAVPYGDWADNPAWPLTERAQ
jgi:hypothetical protein